MRTSLVIVRAKQNYRLTHSIDCFRMRLRREHAGYDPYRYEGLVGVLGVYQPVSALVWLVKRKCSWMWMTTNW